MVRTPWGNSDELRERKLRPGPGVAREEVVTNQRERLFGAMVASVAERGYEGTRVSDLVELSGVSSRSFYALFADKRACFLEALGAIIRAGVSFEMKRSEKPGSWEKQARRGFEDFAKLIVDQPATARLCLVDAYAVGPEAFGRFESAAAAFEELTVARLAQSPERAGMPVEMVYAFTGAIPEITRTRLLRGTEAEVPRLMVELWELLMSYRPPPSPLRGVARRAPAPPERIEGHDHAERALRAFTAVVAERGYAAATVGEAIGRAGMSASTFYASFSGKEDALAAALDSGGAQLMAAVLPAARRAEDWAGGVRAGIGAMFSYLAWRPALAQLLAVEVYAAGPDALERRAEALAPLGELLTEGYGHSSAAPPIAAEAIAAAINMLAHRTVRDKGPASLPALAPLCSYIALAPFIGAEAACEVANGAERRAQEAA